MNVPIHKIAGKLPSDELVNQVIVVRGIAASIQAMDTPTFESLNKLLAVEGLTLSHLNKQTIPKDEGNW